MVSIVFASIILVGLASLASYLSFTVVRSKLAAPKAMPTRFYLPTDFFVTLVLLGNFWMIILVLLGSQELLPADRPMITIIASLMAPFLSWWRKKKAGI